MTQTTTRQEHPRIRSNCDERTSPTHTAAPAPPVAPPRPPRHKMALLTWAGAYVVITGLLWALGPLMAPWPLPLRTLLLSVVMVVTLTWAVMPFLTRRFGRWLMSG